MRDRRNISRLKLNIRSNLYLTNEVEITGHINDISERGISVSFSEEDAYRVLQEGRVIILQFIDNFKYKRNEKKEIIIIQAYVLRVNVSGNEIKLGCAVRDSEYEKYVNCKKVDIFLAKDRYNNNIDKYELSR